MSDLNIKIEEALTYLCRPSSANFYAFTISPLKRIYCHATPTFSVGPEGSRYVLRINPTFAGQQPFDRTVMILEHEVLHIVLRHISRGLALFQLCESPTAQHYFMMIKPIAADLAVNAILRKNHPHEVLCPPDRKDLGWAILSEDYDLPDNQAFEEYFLLLLDQAKKQVPDPEKVIHEVVQSLREEIEAAGGISPGSLLDQIGAKLDEKMEDGEGSAEDGEGSAEDGEGSSGSFRDNVKQHLKQAILEHLHEYIDDVTDPAHGHHLDAHGRSVLRNGVKSYKSTGRGTLPSGMSELIARFLAPPTVAWTDLLNAYCVNAQQSKPLRGFTHISKNRAAMQRFYENLDVNSAETEEHAEQLRRMVAIGQRIPLFPGSMRDKRFEIYFVVDTSGSMSHDMLALALSELKHVQAATDDMVIHVLYVDAGVGKEYVLESGGEIDFELVGRGGTNFETAFAHIKETATQCDMVVYVTDGIAPKPTTQLECATLWLITPGGHHIMDGVAGHITLEMQDVAASDSKAA